MIRPAGFGLAVGLLWVSAFTLVKWPEAQVQAPQLTAVALALVLALLIAVAARESSASFRSKAVLFALAGLVIATALASASPAILTAALIIVVGRLRKEAVLEVLGVVGLVGYGVWLYYGLQVSLLWTSGAFVLAGGLLVAARGLLLGISKPTQALEGSILTPFVRRDPRNARPALLLLPSALVVAIVFGLVIHKENIIRDGRTVYLELGARDPRSFMQGDYVVVRYSYASRLAWDSCSSAIFTVDKRGVGSFKLPTFDDATALAANEVRIRCQSSNGQKAFGATAFFFGEGQGARWQNARYAELKVDPSGTTVLVGLRDAELNRL